MPEQRVPHDVVSEAEKVVREASWDLCPLEEEPLKGGNYSEARLIAMRDQTDAMVRGIQMAAAKEGAHGRVPIISPPSSGESFSGNCRRKIMDMAVFTGFLALDIIEVATNEWRNRRQK